jgi:hypothetical protein
MTGRLQPRIVAKKNYFRHLFVTLVSSLSRPLSDPRWRLPGIPTKPVSILLLKGYNRVIFILQQFFNSFPFNFKYFFEVAN